MTNYLGISEGYHDAGLALINDKGKILFAGHSERYTKVKNDAENCQAIWSNMADYKDSENLEVHYYEKPTLKRMRLFCNGNWKEAFSRKETSFKDFKYTAHSHHLSHAATAFQTSPFNSAAVVIVDAIGEWDTATIWHASYDDNGFAKYKKVWSQRYPHSIGLFYTAMTDRVGLRPLEDEYVLMGMAAYGDSTYLYRKMVVDFIDDFEQIKFKRNLHRGCKNWAEFSTNNDIAAATQLVTERLLAYLHVKAEWLTNEKNVCYGGGVALNCAFNTQLSNTWSNVWIPPNPGDCGSALGAAALGYGKVLSWENPFLGYDINSKLDVNEVIHELKFKGVVGVANGRAEWGPRALGNRSLLADPRQLDIKDRVNEIKRRQMYRPFAPAVLAEHADRYYWLKKGLDYRYMQYAVDAKSNEFRSTMHVDRTARVQIVRNDGSNMRKILEAWYEKTDCPVLLNTSLNIRHQPIVNDRLDAKAFSDLYGVKVCS